MRRIGAIVALLVALAGVAYVVWRPGSDAVDTSDWAVPDPDKRGMPPAVVQQLAIARAAVVRGPDSGEAWGKLGTLYDLYEHHGAAVTCYERARLLAPEEFRWAYSLAMVEDARGADLDRVTACFEQAVELDPSYVAAFYRYGDALVRRGAMERASEAYAEVVALRPGLAVGHRGLGQTLLALGRPEQALAEFETAARLDPDDPKTYSALARTHQRLGDAAGAAEAARRAASARGKPDLPDPVRSAIEAKAQDPSAAIMRAQARMQQGAFAQAIPDLRRFLQSLPDHAVGQYFLGQCYLRTGDVPGAILQFEKAISLDPALVGAHLDLGAIREQRRDWAAATEHYRQAVAAEPDQPDYHARLGNALERLGRRNEAITHYRRAVELQPDHPAGARLPKE